MKCKFKVFYSSHISHFSFTGKLTILALNELVDLSKIDNWFPSEILLLNFYFAFRYKIRVQLSKIIEIPNMPDSSLRIFKIYD